MNRADPYPFYAQLRAKGPVQKIDWPGLGQIWAVTQYREALSVFKDSDFVRSTDSLALPGEPPRQRSGSVRGFGHDLLEMDPPDHTRLRKLVSKAFTPRMVDRLAPKIEQLADEILQRAKARGNIELISEYATVIPITIISDLMGFPIKNILGFRSFIYALTLAKTPSQIPPALQAQKARFIEYLKNIFVTRRAEPRDDMISALVHAQQDGDRLSPDELTGMVYLLLMAGFVTTVNLIGNGTLSLLRHPDQWDLLRQNPGLADTAIDELLRFEGPLALSAVCYAASDVDMAGQKIARGTPLRVLIPSANRDEQQFRAADTLDVTRSPCPHLTFGQGMHYCLGAPLARLEGKIALLKLIEHAPDLRLADPSNTKWLAHHMFRGLEQLPLRL